MSTLNVTNAQITTLKDASGGNSNTPAAINSGIAKYWCTFQGSGTAAILDSFNSAGFSDSGTGIYKDKNSDRNISVGNIYNRLVAYRGKVLYHRSIVPGFGNTLETSRLTQTFFFDIK